MTHTSEEIKALAENQYVYEPISDMPIANEKHKNTIDNLRSAFINGYTKALEQVKSEGWECRWVKASERLPLNSGSPQIHYRINGFHKVHGNFHYSIDDDRCEGEIVFTVIGGELHEDYEITKEKWSMLEWLEEAAHPVSREDETK